MATTLAHYEHQLAPIYVWMVGGLEAGLRAAADEVRALDLPLAPGDLVVDLGAGFGGHAVFLAQQGARVTAIDTSPVLLRTLADVRGALPIRIVEDDLTAFPMHLEEPPSAILCLGDTLTHLPDVDAVRQLVERAAASLRRGGVLAISLRDYSVPLPDDRRFIPVRADDDRILLCFLEYEPAAVKVHDIVHERQSSGTWQTRVSHYRKLRLDPVELDACLASHGFEVRRDVTPRGLVRLLARRT